MRKDEMMRRKLLDLAVGQFAAKRHHPKRISGYNCKSQLLPLATRQNSERSAAIGSKHKLETLSAAGSRPRRDR